MRQAITTKYLGPTNTKGSRIKATCDGGTLTLSYAHELNSDQNHALAAHKLAEKLGWVEKNRLIGGGLPNNAGYVFVLEAK